MSEIEVPLKPFGREDIQKLEAVLLLGTVSRKDVIEKMRSADPKDRITWIDSLGCCRRRPCKRKGRNDGYKNS